METTIWGLGVIYRDNGKENGNHYLGFRGYMILYTCWGVAVASRDHAGGSSLRKMRFILFGVWDSSCM